MNVEELKKIEIKRFHTLLAKLGHMDKKPLVLEQYGVKSTSDLSLDQLKEVNGKLANRFRHETTVTGDKKIEQAERRKILSMVYQMGWTVGGKIDWDVLNVWMLKYGYLHKPLNSYKVNEFPKLIRQFQAIRDDKRKEKQ